jgi:prepilin-type N-terminal cleavage/methylation domain-containing protein
VTRRSNRGVSLLEALVALAVMSVGAVAVVGMQATLRFNSDVSKQRAEALRLGQELIEEWRGFTSLTAVGGSTDWADIATTGTPTTHAGSNGTFSRSAVVVPKGVGTDDPLSDAVHVTVTWTDRSNVDQRVDLNTIISGAMPDLAGNLFAPTDASSLRNPSGRHAAIPPAAIDQGDGTSLFSPPASAGVHWVFDNVSGAIRRVCPPEPAVCDPASTAVFLTGFVRFSTAMVQPTPAQAEAPSSPVMTVSVMVDESTPIDTDVSCFHYYGSDYVEYFCAVPTDLTDSKWSGKSMVTGITVASSIADSTASAYKICRYTTVRSNSAVVPTDLKNEEHPLNYVAVGEPLVNQNFLVIRAGSAGTPFVCPDDDTSTPNVSGATWYHQPSV